MLRAKDIIGRWESKASEKIVNPDGSVIYGVRDFVFTERAWALHFHAFGDVAASFKLFTLRVEGTYEIMKPAPSIPGAFFTDFRFSSRHMTAHIPDLLQLFEGAKCGQGSWSLGVEQDVSVTGAVFIPSVEKASIEHDLLKLDGDMLFLGDRSHDLSVTPADRLIEYPLIRR